jgi:putative ABC transport system permease protein
MVSSKRIVWIKFSLANLFRNSRRSFYTIIAIAIGYAAINIFGGFTSYIFTNLKDSFIYSQANGHLTVFKKGFLTEGRIDPTKYLIAPEEYNAIDDICKNIPEVIITAPQMQIMGLISNGEVSTVFIGSGSVPSETQAIQRRATGMVGELKLYTGKALQDDTIFGVGLTNGLADKLNLDIGSNAIAMAPTVDGRINALDVKPGRSFHLFTEK